MSIAELDDIAYLIQEVSAGSVSPSQIQFESPAARCSARVRGAGVGDMGDQPSKYATEGELRLLSIVAGQTEEGSVVAE